MCRVARLAFGFRKIHQIPVRGSAIFVRASLLSAFVNVSLLDCRCPSVGRALLIAALRYDGCCSAFCEFVVLHCLSVFLVDEINEFHPVGQFHLNYHTVIVLIYRIEAFGTLVSTFQ